MSQGRTVQQTLRTTQIICVQLLLSAIVMVVVAVYFFSATEATAVEPIVPIALGIVAVLNLLAAEFIPALLMRAIQPDTLHGWLNKKFTRYIIEMALRESAAILAFVLYFLSPESANISFTLWVLTCVLMILRFPTEQRFTQNIPAELLRAEVK
jgi:hypothetical protein